MRIDRVISVRSEAAYRILSRSQDYIWIERRAFIPHPIEIFIHDKEANLVVGRCVALSCRKNPVNIDPGWIVDIDDLVTAPVDPLPFSVRKWYHYPLWLLSP